MTGPVARIEPTPENGWLWRRLYAFLLSTAMVVVMALIVSRLEDPAALRQAFYTAAGVLVLTLMFYMGGATLTDIWRLISAVRTTRIINQSTPGPA